MEAVANVVNGIDHFSGSGRLLTNTLLLQANEHLRGKLRLPTKLSDSSTDGLQVGRRRRSTAEFAEEQSTAMRQHQGELARQISFASTPQLPTAILCRW